jgi:ParB family chromosome partitioning protein
MTEANSSEQGSHGPKGSDSAGGKSVRRLGRGLASLLGPAAIPVRVDVPRGTGSTPPRDEPAPSSGKATSPAEDRSSVTRVRNPPAASIAASPAGTLDESDHESAGTPFPGGMGEEIVFLQPSAVARNPHQPRERFTDEAMKTLIESIREHGLMQPIVVRPAAGGFELVAGERRLRAAKALGLERVPAIVKKLDNRQSAEWALIENLQREDLNPLERARGIDRLIREFSLSHQQAAERVGLERASVSNLLRLLDLDPGTASLIARGDLGQGHAKVLLSVVDVGLRTSLAQSVIDRQWSVRRLEAEVRRLVAPASLPPASAMPRGKQRSRTQLDDLERRLSEHLGTRVQILVGRQKGRGRLVIDFHGLEHFDGLMDRMGFQND